MTLEFSNIIVVECSFAIRLEEWNQNSNCWLVTFLSIKFLFVFSTRCWGESQDVSEIIKKHKNPTLVIRWKCRYILWTRLYYCIGKFRSGLVRMWTRCTNFRQDTMGAVKGEQLQMMKNGNFWTIWTTVLFPRGNVLWNVLLIEN